MNPNFTSLNIGREVSSLYFVEDWVDSWYDHTNRIMVTTWFNLSSSIHYRKSYLIQLEAAKIFKPKGFIVDTSKAYGVPYPEDHHWLVTNIFPEAKKLNLRFIINIFPRNSIAKTGVKSALDSGKKFDFDIIEMQSFEEALNFIKSN